MTRTLAAMAVAALVACAGCDSANPMKKDDKGVGTYKPTETNTPFARDLTDAKEGRWVTYAMDAGGNKMSHTLQVVGKDGDNWWVEYWIEATGSAYGILNRIGADKKVVKAWAAAKGDKAWTEIAVKETPKGGATDGEKPTVEKKESDDKKTVKAGDYNCRRIDMKTTYKGQTTGSIAWYSKDAWRLGFQGDEEHGGMVATDAGGSKTWLDGKGEDAKPTIELPKK